MLLLKFMRFRKQALSGRNFDEIKLIS